MSRRARWTALGLVAAAAACSDIAAPIRNDFYEGRLLVPSAAGSGVDSLAFHWPRSRLPVRIWVEDAASLPQHVADAIAAWRQAFLYGEFDATIVSDSSAADVIVRAGAAPPATQFDRARLHSALAPECTGATDLDISADHTQLRLPIRVYVDPGFDPAAPGVPECMALTTTHELGHALGIWRHSDAATDLMYFDPAVTTPSERDLGTAELLYHRTPNVEIVGPVATQ
jgi:predicted Zn-dependent protease